MAAKKPGLMVVIAAGAHRPDGSRMPTAMERRQHAADVEAAFTGRPQSGGTYDPDAEADAGTDDDGGAHGTGTPASGFMPAEDGPFRCDNCQHFTARPQGQQQPGGDDLPGTCNQPEVKTDPQVRGRVEAGSCCSFFAPLSEGAQENLGIG